MILRTLQMSETNDCTVRALADAYAVSYETAHTICKRHGRVDGNGFYIQSSVLPKLNLTLIESAINMRVSSLFATLDSTKVYLCLVAGHIFCIRNGDPVECKDAILWLRQFGHKKVIRLFEVK